MFEWRVRNLMFPAEVYSVDVDGKDLVIRTSNKKYYKRFSVGEMQALGVELDKAALEWSWANNTLLVQYRKPEEVLAFGQDKARAIMALVSKAGGYKELPAAQER